MPEPMTVAAAMAGGEAIKTTADMVSLIGKMVGKLRAQPDVAALKLAAALEEVDKTYKVVNEAFNAYVALAIDEDGLTKNSMNLLAIADGSLTVLVKDGKGHCDKIANIYEKHLRRWFEKALKPAEAADMQNAFAWLGQADEDLFRYLSELCFHLAGEAKQVLALVRKRQYDDAREAVWATYDAFSPLQTEINKTMTHLMDMRNEFIAIARAT